MRREVRRLPDNAVLVRYARANEIADYDQARCDADSHLKWLRSRERSDRID